MLNIGWELEELEGRTFELRYTSQQ